MATIKGALEGAKGSTSGLVFYQRGGKTIMYAKPDRRDGHTPNQMMRRTRWNNIVRTYRAFEGKLFGAFENKQDGVTDYNRFIAVNLDFPLFIPQKQFDIICIAAPYQVSEGSLDSIEVEDLGEQSIRSNIRIGDLVIDDMTTLDQLSYAILQNNTNFDFHDRLVFFEVIQKEGEHADIHVDHDCFRLNEMGNIRVKELLKYGFENIDGYLGARNLPKGCYAWVHIRKEQANQPALVSSQRLINLNKELIETYSSKEAFAAAAKSYGCKDPLCQTKSSLTPRRSPFD